MAACDKITQGQVFNCGTPPNPGLEPEIQIGNFDDLAGLTKDGANDRLITAITMAATTATFKFTAPSDASITTGETAEQAKYGSLVTQTVQFPIKVATAADKLNLKKLINGKFFLITNKKDKGATGENKYHFHGEHGGGKITYEMVDDAGGDESSGLYLCTFTATNQLPSATIFDTDEGSTDALVTALLTA